MQETNLTFRVLSALKWLTAARTAGQLVTWVITLIVIRILSPEDYGLVAAVTVVLGFAALTNELGITPALIQRKQSPVQTRPPASVLSCFSSIFRPDAAFDVNWL